MARTYVVKRGDTLHPPAGHWSLGIDGVYSDFADTSVATRVLHRLQTDASDAECLKAQERRNCD